MSRAEAAMHWISRKLSIRTIPQIDAGVFANRRIGQGELLCMWGGELRTSAQLRRLNAYVRVHAIQVHDDLYLVPHTGLEPADHFNHCCDPNAGLQGQIGLVAIRSIRPGEQVCYDYAMSDASAYDEFECHCDSPRCRGVIRGTDWMLPQLQERYQGYFSPYLQHRILDLRKRLTGT